MLKTVLSILTILFTLQLSAQTLGGNAVFSFLKLSNSPQLSALGGINITAQSDDAGLVFQNPALLSPAMHAQVNAVFNSLYDGIKVYHLAGAYTADRLNTNFSAGLHYFNYGSINETDASGNVLGKFRPVDWVFQVSASRKYLEKWNYGLALKFISSDYGQYSSNGVAADAGILFADTSKKITASLVAKNMGFQLKKYEGTLADDLPFDLQAGITKRLAKAPFSFSLTAHHLHRFDINYNDTAFNNENGFANDKDQRFSFSKLVSHLVLATTIHIDKRLEVQAGYNFLRRKELNMGNAGNGLNGFSMGVSVLFPKIQVRYGRAYYQNNSACNQLGINMKLNSWGKK